jgi:hypothetical protein
VAVIPCVLACLSFASGAQLTSKDKLDAKAVLKAFYERMHEAPTAMGVIESHAGAGHRTEFRMMRPNLFTMISPDFEARGDGKTMLVQVKGRKVPMRFRQVSGAPDITGFEALTTDEIPKYVKAGKLKPGHFKGKRAYLIPVLKDERRDEVAVTLYIDQNTLLPIACEYAANGKSEFLSYENVVLGAPMKRKDFSIAKK